MGQIQIWDVYRQAIWALRENRMRTLLSILGIFIGIVAVMVVGTVTKSVKDYVFSELSSYGLNTIWVYRLREEKSPYGSIRSGSGIDNQDLKMLRQHCCPAVKQVSPEVYFQNWQQLFRYGNRYNNALLEGVDQQFFSIAKENFAMGRSFREEDILRRRNVAIIGSKVREVLFGEYQNPIGKSIRTGEHKFTVIGLLQAKSRDFLASIGAAEDYDVNNRIFIPYTVHQQLIGNKDIHQLVIEAAGSDQTQLAIDQVMQLLSRNHGNRFTYTADTMEYWVNTANDILSKISLIGLVAASVSLLVGGVGIMNIMTTSVVERTREIGIRKAIGATRKDIERQFILEAVVISTLGGAIGLIIGYGASFVAQAWMNMPVIPPVTVVFVGLFVSIIVGLASGYYPAKRAAAMQPVRALRYE